LFLEAKEMELVLINLQLSPSKSFDGKWCEH